VFSLRNLQRDSVLYLYVDDLNIIGNPKDIEEACNHLTTEFEMKDLGKTKYCLGLQLEHLPSGILVHQSADIQKILEKFNMDKSYPSKTLFVVHSLEMEKDQFKPREEGEEILGPEVPDLSAFHISVPLDHLCILQIAPDPVSHLQ